MSTVEEAAAKLAERLGAHAKETVYAQLPWDLLEELNDDHLREVFDSALEMGAAVGYVLGQQEAKETA